MAKNTSILLGTYFENLINEQVVSGRFSSASEVVRSALRLFEQQDILYRDLINELVVGEKSGIISDFDRDHELTKYHVKYLKNEV